jgi:hypothetical protein
MHGSMVISKHDRNLEFEARLRSLQATVLILFSNQHALLLPSTHLDFTNLLNLE